MPHRPNLLLRPSPPPPFPKATDDIPHAARMPEDKQAVYDAAVTDLQTVIAAIESIRDDISGSIGSHREYWVTDGEATTPEAELQTEYTGLSMKPFIQLSRALLSLKEAHSAFTLYTAEEMTKADAAGEAKGLRARKVT